MIAFADGRMVLYPGLMARIEINAPKRRNALSRSMWLAVPLICDAIEADEAIRAVLLTASADAGGTFCAGADISEFAEVYASVASTTYAISTTDLCCLNREML